MNATVHMYFDSRMSKEGELYLKYQVYFAGKQKYFSIGILLDEQDVVFLKQYKSGLTGGIRDDYKRNLWHMVYGVSFIDPATGTKKVSYLQRAKDLVASLGDKFTFEAFKEKIHNTTPALSVQKKEGDLIADLRERYTTLKSSGRLSDAGLFDNTASSLIRFTGKEVLPYEQVTKAFLEKYEKWMLEKGKKGKSESSPDLPASITTVGIYIRQIRTMFNLSFESKPENKSLYPFGKNGYTIPASRNIKKALTKTDIGKIVAYQAEPGSSRDLARDLWLFSYLCNGINFADILSIQWKNVDKKNNTIVFVRQKTKGTKKSKLKNVQIDLIPLTSKIIEKWGDKKGLYVFPFYGKDMSEDRKKAVKNQVIKNTNYHMGKIAEELDIKVDVKTYSARHSFATILLLSEAPLAFISQKLDHSSITTTQNYLGSFEDSQSKKYLSALLPDEE